MLEYIIVGYNLGCFYDEEIKGLKMTLEDFHKFYSFIEILKSKTPLDIEFQGSYAIIKDREVQ